MSCGKKKKSGSSVMFEPGITANESAGKTNPGNGLNPELSEIRERAWKLLDRKRIPHVAGCEKEAVKLAARWGENVTEAALAGMLHDCTKRLSYGEQLELIKKWNLECEPSLLDQPKLLHPVTGAEWARRNFNVSDKVYKGIRWHTTGRENMTLFEKIIYLADYIEETRDFEGLEELRKLAYEDIDKAMILAYEMSAADLRSRGIEPWHKP